jgi:Flp pilus assembly pilin Flp
MPPSRAPLLADTRGANLVEYMVLVGLIAILTLAGWRAFGSRIDAKAEAQARCIETFSCPGGTPGAADGQPLVGAAALPAKESNGRPDEGGAANPDLDGDNEGAKYEKLDGEVAIEGPGDGRAVHESDVSQGSLADCYLAATLGGLALRDPEVLEKAVRDNGDGTYTVTFYEDGFWPWSGKEKVEITVTGEFPRKDGTWVYMKPGDDSREMWPMLIEKAYAEWQGDGDYGDIEQGNATVPMEALTGRDAESTTDFGSVYDRWERGEAITLLTPDMSDDSKKKAMFADGKLLFNHYYYVVGVNREKGTVTVRNPHGWHKSEIEIPIADVEKHFEHMASVPTN